MGSALLAGQPLRVLVSCTIAEQQRYVMQALSIFKVAQIVRVVFPSGSLPHPFEVFPVGLSVNGGMRVQDFDRLVFNSF